MPSKISMVKPIIAASEASTLISPPPQSSGTQESNNVSKELAENSSTSPAPIAADIRSSLDDDLDLSEDSEDESALRINVKGSDTSKVDLSTPSDQVTPQAMSVECTVNESNMDLQDGTGANAVLDDDGNEGLDDRDQEDLDDDGEAKLFGLENPSMMCLREIKYRSILDELLATFKNRHRKQNKSLEHLRTR